MKPFTIIAIMFFSIMTLVHILRLIFQWEVLVDGTPIPVWFSAIGAVLACLLAYMLWRESFLKE
jgi:type VI protein secretion system component VasF